MKNEKHTQYLGYVTKQQENFALKMVQIFETSSYALDDFTEKEICLIALFKAADSNNPNEAQKAKAEEVLRALNAIDSEGLFNYEIREVDKVSELFC